MVGRAGGRGRSTLDAQSYLPSTPAQWSAASGPEAGASPPRAAISSNLQSSAGHTEQAAAALTQLARGNDWTQLAGAVCRRLGGENPYHHSQLHTKVSGGSPLALASSGLLSRGLPAASASSCHRQGRGTWRPFASPFPHAPPPKLRATCSPPQLSLLSSLQGNLKQVVRPLEENQELFGAVNLRGAELDFQAERDCLQRLQEAQDPGRADFSLGSPLYLNLFPVRPILHDRTRMAAGPWCKAGLQQRTCRKRGRAG